MMNKLFDVAEKARGNSYSPYSAYKVGASVLTDTDEIFSGCNVENASYGLTICAERNAMFSAVTAGHTDFKKLVVVSNYKSLGRSSPCGCCRQVMVQFMDESSIVEIYVGDELISSWTVGQLLPNAFGL